MSVADRRIERVDPVVGFLCSRGRGGGCEPIYQGDMIAPCRDCWGIGCNQQHCIESLDCEYADGTDLFGGRECFDCETCGGEGLPPGAEIVSISGQQQLVL